MTTEVNIFSGKLIHTIVSPRFCNQGKADGPTNPEFVSIGVNPGFQVSPFTIHNSPFTQTR